MINANHLKLASFLFQDESTEQCCRGLVSLGFHSKASQTKGFKQQKHIFSWFLEVGSPRSRSSRVGFLQGFSLGLGCGHVLTALSHCLPLYVCPNLPIGTPPVRLD